ncbi:NfeD family protein [Umezawaea tangerina]|uniref:Membrane protein implicated in regulation of membrane protease activity n=1 Tax=Umezawaea tangerina TaxID=84725 RepID=A0A2T0SN34_9PSEU|nr:NfeD family protein [Umezawaea tangerina]PRY34827.1 membrane protein implicated in regulation of membrane protease activity [Umezawaea tangerina]
MAALIWLIIGALLVGAEIVSGDFVLLMLGLAALGGAGVAALGAGTVISVVVFTVASILLVLGARPVLKRRLEIGHGLKSNVEALIGVKAVVVSRVDGHEGRVKLHGEIWSARSLDHRVLEPGTEVTVFEISGATAVVLAES